MEEWKRRRRYLKTRTERRKGKRKEESLRKLEQPELIKAIQRQDSAPSEKEYDDKKHYIKMNERERERTN